MSEAQTPEKAQKRPFLPPYAPCCPRVVPRPGAFGLAYSRNEQHLKIIREIFPSQTHLTPKQIARALHGPGKDTKKRAEDVREQLDAYTLIPGIRKEPGVKRWSVKVVDLAAALDGEAVLRPDMSGPIVLSGRRNSRFKNPGSRIARLWAERSHALWIDILEEMALLNSESIREALNGKRMDRPNRELDPGVIL